MSDICNFEFDKYVHLKSGVKSKFRVRIKDEEDLFEISPEDLRNPKLFLDHAFGIYHKVYKIFVKQSGWGDALNAWFTEIGETIDHGTGSHWKEIFKNYTVTWLINSPSADEVEEIKEGRSYRTATHYFFRWSDLHNYIRGRFNNMNISTTDLSIALIELGATKDATIQEEGIRIKKLWKVPVGIVESYNEEEE